MTDLFQHLAAAADTFAHFALKQQPEQLLQRLLAAEGSTLRIEIDVAGPHRRELALVVIEPDGGRTVVTRVVPSDMH